ncbi:hypothetical protein ACG04Q_10740 [Roseateles sp. DXS20W]|uniref:DUF2249 domain-containing protein n=1 Tax=Pelomonas lactea TaxID=3299030 RepID=A0ABW7GJL6_9BURK
MNSEITTDLRPLTTANQDLLAVFNGYCALLAGQAMLLVSNRPMDHVQRHLDSMLESDYLWEVLDQGPAQWRARVTKLEAFQTCCGACG